LQDRYRMWTNSKTTAYNFGAGLGLKYLFVKNFTMNGNLTYARLQRRSGNDGLEDGFNTPAWIVNLSVGNSDLYQGFGFMVTYRWQDSYYWQSFLVNGDVPAYQTVDLQVSKKLKQVLVKVGGSNVFNHYYNSFLGGPSVGGFYYVTVGYGL
jgi:hypothetical protein